MTGHPITPKPILKPRRPKTVTQKPVSKRRNRTVTLGDVLGGALDPVFKKRGFASESLLTHWHSIAPKPYNTCAFPDQLKWSRGNAGADGAILFLRCSQGHALALSHESDKIVQAVNRYYGYYLVGSVKLSAAPFTPHSAPKGNIPFTPSAETVKRVDSAVENVADEGLRHALRDLGLKLHNKNAKNK